MSVSIYYHFLLSETILIHLGNSWSVRDDMKEVNVDFRLVRHYDLHQLPVDRGIMRGLLEDSLEDGGDVVLYNRGR